MYDKRQSVIEKFEQNFSIARQEKFALYGLGKNTEIILEQCREYNIVALLDRTRIGERVWNLPIVSVEEAYKMGVDRIIIVASSVNTPIIFRRIADECEQYNISVYDMDGRRLIRNNGQFVLDAFYENCREEKLRELINASDVVSFDIFDTLLVRNVLFPEDIFEIVGEKCNNILPAGVNFLEHRIRCERKLYLSGNPQISDIYTELAGEMGLSRELANQIMKAEIDEERQCLHAREKIMSLAREAYESGKKICCTSDMYLSKDILEEILVREGYDFLDNVFVSCEYGLSKTDGLFSVVRDKYHNSKILHVGDNRDADITAALNDKVDAVFQIPSIYKMISDSTAGCILDKEMSLEKRVSYGIMFSNEFNDPFLFEKTKGIFDYPG